MEDKYEIIIAGSGGQGLIMAGMLLAESGILEGKNVVQTQTYGIATRGGFSKSEVIIAQDEIIFQEVENPDIIVVLSEEAMQIYKDVADTLVIYDTDRAQAPGRDNFMGFPFTSMAIQLGNPAAINMIVLGLIAELRGVVMPGSLETVIVQKLSSKSRINVQAMHKGMELGGVSR